MFNIHKQLILLQWGMVEITPYSQYINPYGIPPYLTPELEAMAARDAASRIGLMEDYLAIYKKAEAGRTVVADEYTAADATFNRAQDALKPELQSEIRAVAHDLTTGLRYVEAHTGIVIDEHELQTNPFTGEQFFGAPGDWLHARAQVKDDEIAMPSFIDPATGILVKGIPYAPDNLAIAQEVPLPREAPRRQSDALILIDPITGLPQEGEPPSVLKVDEKIVAGYAIEIMGSYHEVVRKEVNKRMKEQPELELLFGDGKPLNDIFLREHVQNAPRKQLDIDADVKTSGGLLEALLQKNPGVAVADIHVFDESSKLLADHMDVLVRSGVKTVYVEAPENFFRKIDRLTVAEIKELQQKRVVGDVSLADPFLQALLYGVAEKDDSMGSYVGMIAAAKEHGLRVVNIDRKGEARRYEVGMGEHRIHSTNFTWADAIEKDRAAMVARGEDPGKYVIFGGIAHFTAGMKSNGLVDEGLGVPVIAFDRRGKEAAFERTPGGNAPDFYLPGGMDYLDTKKHLGAAELKHGADALSKFALIPGVSEVVALMGGVAKQIELDVVKGMRKVEEPMIEKRIPLTPWMQPDVQEVRELPSAAPLTPNSSDSRKILR